MSAYTPGAIDQAGRKADGAFVHRAPDLERHGPELVGRRARVARAHDQEADRPVSHQRGDVDREALAAQDIEVAPEGGPVPGKRPAGRGPSLSMTSWRRAGVRGAGLAPQLPTTSSVKPWWTLLSAVGSPGRTKSACECMSMNPGATTWPVASITRAAPASGKRSIASMRSPAMATSARRAGRPVPSITVPPRIRMSSTSSASWLRRPAPVPLGRLLVGPANPEHGGLREGVADDLERGGQPGPREPVRHREGAEPQVVRHPREVRRGDRLVQPGQRECGRPGRRREDRVELGHRRRVGTLVLSLLAERLEVIVRRHPAALEDACADVGVERERGVLGERADRVVTLGREDPARSGEVVLERPRQPDRLEPRVEARKRLERPIVGVEDLGVDPGTLGAGQDAEAQARHPAAKRRHWIDGRLEPRPRIVGVRALERAEEDRRVLDRSRHRSRRVEGGGQRQDAVRRDAADGHLQPDDPAEGCRQAHRPAGVGADRHGRERGGDRHARAAGRAARRPVDAEVPGIPRRAELRVGPVPAHRELDRVGLAEHDHARLDEAPRQGRGHRRDTAGPRLRPAGGDSALELHQVLQRDRDAVEWPDAVARAQGALRALGREPRLVRVDGHERVERGVTGRDPREERLDQVDGRQPAALESGREFGEGGERGILHGDACYHARRRTAARRSSSGGAAP